MNESSKPRGLVASEPRFAQTAAMLADDMRRLSAERLSELFACSVQIAETNRRRYEIFGTDEAEIMPAALAYFGQAYKHLKTDTLSNEDLLWANDHLWISSCLYGLLRPLDGINTYRMEGGFPLPCTGGMKVSEFWRPLLTDALIESVNADDGILIYLDTEEFRQLFDWKRVVKEVRGIIEPSFHVLKNGKNTTPSVWAKTCRGAMTRFIIENRASEVTKLREFSYEGFKYQKDWTFVRE